MYLKLHFLFMLFETSNIAPFVRSSKWREIRVNIFFVRILNRQTTQTSASNQRKPNKLSLVWLAASVSSLTDAWAPLNQAQSRSMARQLEHTVAFPALIIATGKRFWEQMMRESSRRWDSNTQDFLVQFLMDYSNSPLKDVSAVLYLHKNIVLHSICCAQRETHLCTGNK